MNKVVEDLRKEKERCKEAMMRMEGDVKEAGGQLALLMQVRTELDTHAVHIGYTLGTYWVHIGYTRCSCRSARSSRLRNS